MSTHAMLNHVLALFQQPQPPNTVSQIHGTCVSLLSTLSNPLNITVLTAHLLTAPAIWHRPGTGLEPPLAVLSIFNAAASRLQANPGPLSCSAWAKAVARGTDARAAHWQHALVFSGILIGFSAPPPPPTTPSLSSHKTPEASLPRPLSPSMRHTLEISLVKAANLALLRPLQDGPLAADSLVLALTHVQAHLSPRAVSQLSFSTLLPLAISALGGAQSFDGWSFFAPIAADVVAASPPNGPISWPATSPSFAAVQALASQPIPANLGPLANLAALAIRNAADPDAVVRAHEHLISLTQALWESWQRLPFAQIEPNNEDTQLAPETAGVTAPALRTLLQKYLFATTAILNAVMARCVLDASLRRPDTASQLAAGTLRAMRDLFFVSMRDGNAKFQIYRFTYLCAVDVLAHNPAAAAALLARLKPAPASTMSQNSATATVGAVPLDMPTRLLDLFYLNLAEQLSLALATSDADLLIVQPASTYLSHAAPASPVMRELFEAAHSAVLSVLACPQHAALASSLVPYYAAQLLGAFPALVSPRQFRLAFATVLGILAPPLPASAAAPGLAEALVETVRHRAVDMPSTGKTPLPPLLGEEETMQAPVSEQTGLLLALVDALPALPLGVVDEWLAVTAEAIAAVEDENLKIPLAKRFWEVLESGEFDVERSMVAVEWWARGGAAVLGTRKSRSVVTMSGAATGLKDGSRF
ncbi:hypothetical protein Cpir12675_004854 [Ceratocystis pirilliformis]|uniref:Peroxisomal membrane protein PEX17 n=1 Tax=Ceratocystis pirilliformis TaxID=259994 RepID=A0ABR3YTG0_9PEZI